MIFVLVYFRVLLKWWCVPLYHDWINVENTIIWLVTFQTQIFKFKTNFCVCRFFLQNLFLKLINIFVFFVFILVDAFSGSIKTEITKNLFTLAENNFGERKLSCSCLNFGEILFAGTKRAIPGGQYRSILPARVANQKIELAADCPLAELAI